jgi:sporulation protein YlmC with PRC-barrel domain
MLLKKGTDVQNTQGEKVGELDRVVIDPSTRDVTHVIVRKGLLFKEDRVIPMQRLQISDEDHLILDTRADDLEAFPPFTETEFLPVEDGEELEQDFRSREREGYLTQVLWYPTVSGTPGYAQGFFSTNPAETYSGYAEIEERNIPEDTVPLKEGARVLASDGEHVGDLKEVIIGRERQQASHFVISEGKLLGDDKLIPMHWVRRIREEEVELSVDSEFVKRLPKYEERA